MSAKRTSWMCISRPSSPDGREKLIVDVHLAPMQPEWARKEHCGCASRAHLGFVAAALEQSLTKREANGSRREESRKTLPGGHHLTA
jgi:hypothetical protein